MIRPLLAAAFIALCFISPSAAQDGTTDEINPPAFTAIINEARDFCAQMGGTQFTYDHSKITFGDLNEDGIADYVIKSGDFQCTGAASIYGGSGGNTLYIMVSQNDPMTYHVIKEFGFNAKIQERFDPPIVAISGRCKIKAGYIGLTHYEYDAATKSLRATPEGQNCA